tara:strand:+ start:84 stop:239 length:156 start_codon:yes stop_codon:yes gene_type:complete
VLKKTLSIFLLQAELIERGYRNKKPINLAISEFRTPTFFTQYNLASNNKVI